MASKKTCPAVPDRADLALEFMPPPRSSGEVVRLLQGAAGRGLVQSKMVMHLAEMSALFPQETVEAFRIFCARRSGDN